MHRAAPNIYGGELVEVTHSVVADLKRVARTRHKVAMYLANGHGAWEAALANVLSPGDLVLVPATGRFGMGWADMDRKLLAGLAAKTPPTLSHSQQYVVTTFRSRGIIEPLDDVAAAVPAGCRGSLRGKLRPAASPAS